MQKIRNFCIIAHIDHGKSTLADRLLEFTGTVDKRVMREQILDSMDLERERGITIKLAPVRMEYKGYILNLIDTPGHVDFTYEVSRSLAACEGALLVVDATQGVQAQTIANLYLALEQNLKIIPIVNKIDLQQGEIEKTRQELKNLLGVSDEEVILASGKEGIGIEEIIDAVIERIPPPKEAQKDRLKALIFDSTFDEFRGVVVYVRVFSGDVKAQDNIIFIGSNKKTEVLEVGAFRPSRVKKDKLSLGEIGYLVTGLKDIQYCRVGDTITEYEQEQEDYQKLLLPGYKEIKPMVYAGIFPRDGAFYPKLKDAIEKLKLNDASLYFEQEFSDALGYGFRCGFLGLLHLDIVIERLKREYNLELTVTTPSVAYEVINRKGEVKIIKSPSEIKDRSNVTEVKEPWVKVDIVTPKNFLGSIMQLAQNSRGEYLNTEYIEGESQDAQTIIHYNLPLAAVIVDFYDKLKTVSSGYASLNYEFIEFRPVEIEKLDIYVAEEIEDALSMIVYQDEVLRIAREVVATLKEKIPRQMFEVKIQAKLGGKVVASERIPPMRKDVTAKLYGGDVTRKKKLLEKQKRGKKRLKETGKVEIPLEAYISLLKRG